MDRWPVVIDPRFRLTGLAHGEWKIMCSKRVELQILIANLYLTAALDLDQLLSRLWMLWGGNSNRVVGCPQLLF